MSSSDKSHVVVNTLAKLLPRQTPASFRTPLLKTLDTIVVQYVEQLVRDSCPNLPNTLLILA